MNPTISSGGAAASVLWHCKVIWDGKKQQVSVGVTNGDGSVPVWRTEQVETAVTVAKRELGEVSDDIHEVETISGAAELLRDPGATILSRAIAAVTQVAALHAGLGVAAAKLIGMAAGRLAQDKLANRADRDRIHADLEFDCDIRDDEGLARNPKAMFSQYRDGPDKGPTAFRGRIPGSGRNDKHDRTRDATRNRPSPGSRDFRPHP
jgi:hypothetical protein